ncbi:MAG: formamidopyrimidine-DNA glycosylase [Candidatus Angelobacter sp. Gp1-AA117]|nr:MAG: formamidopyrimidine-DNA glycosylase [Candidatus Angelobacter sp. Gp1-AA117]
MPELPDIVVYLEALEQRIQDHVLEQAEIRGPFLLRTVDPPIESIQGKKITELRRVGKRIALGFENHLWLVFHLMIAGRLHWSRRRVTPDGRRTLAALHFDSGTLTLTEAGTRKRASLHLVAGEAGLAKLDPGGIDVFAASLEQFRAALTATNHTLKRALTDPHIFSGIGNAYSDEILHAAQLSPVTLTQRLNEAEITRLFEATRHTLNKWTHDLRTQSGAKFPEKVTAFHEAMAVHGKYGKPCPRCRAKIQRIRYASNETNYCAPCQTQGKLLADRSLSRLLGKDWPRTLEELEDLKAR